MTTSTLRLLSGLSLALGAVGCLIGGVLHPVVDGEAHSVAAILSPGESLGTLALLTGTILLLLGLPGVYGWLAPSLGKIGFVGFLLYVAGNLLSAIPHLAVMAFVAPVVARRAPELISDDDMIIDSPLLATEQMIFGLILVAGFLIMGIALVRSRQVPRWVGIVAIVGVMIIFTPARERAVITGLQIELARAVVAAALGILAIRSTRLAEAPVTARAEPLGVS